jgi:hypothetical protein
LTRLLLFLFSFLFFFLFFFFFPFFFLFFFLFPFFFLLLSVIFFLPYPCVEVRKKVNREAFALDWTGVGTPLGGGEKEKSQNPNVIPNRLD